MFNKVVFSYIFIILLFLVVGILSGGKTLPEWVVTFSIYVYFSYLMISFLFKKEMVLPHGILNKNSYILRKIVFIMSIVMMIIFSFN